MYLGLGLRVGGARSEQIIGITTGAYLDVDSLIVGLVLQDSFVSGTYPDFKGNTVTETVTGWYVNGVLLTGPDATSYTLQSGDDIGQAQITLSASGANNRIYYSGIESIVDYSHVQGDITYEVPIGGGSVPDAFVLANWSIADDGTNGDATVTITTLPADNGSAITDLEYRIGTGAAVSWGATSTGTYGISGLPDDTATNIQIRALNANGAGAWSDTKSVTTTGIPDAFTAGMWTLTDLASGGDARIAISSLPDDTGSAITDLEYKKDAGSWTSLSGTTTGNYDLTDVFTDGVSADVLIRAVNANGSGADSDTKSVTTTTADVTAPTLSSPTDAANGSSAATGSVSTNEGNGTLYWVVSTSGTAPSAAQVKAGQMHTGAAAADSGSQSVSGTGVQTLSPAPSGLTASTAYTIHFMHEDAAANQSSVASGDGFTTSAAGITGHDTVHRVESTATASSYNFTLNGITSGQLIHLPVKAMGDSTIHTPATWTVTLNGVAATFVVAAASGSSGTFPSVGVFRVVADATGNLALAITLNASSRACCVDARYLNGVHAATPVVGTPKTENSLNTDVATINSPNAYAPQAAGNVILTDIAIKGGDITGLVATSGADGHVTDKTGTNATSDITDGAAYNVAPDTSAITIDWDWTGADRVSSTNVEYQPA